MELKRLSFLFNVNGFILRIPKEIDTAYHRSYIEHLMYLAIKNIFGFESTKSCTRWKDQVVRSLGYYSLSLVDAEVKLFREMSAHMANATDIKIDVCGDNLVIRVEYD